MAQPDRFEGGPDAAVGVDGVERQLQPAAVSQRVAASKAAAEKRTAKAMSADERAIKRRADQRRRRAKASDRGEQHGRATAVEGKQHSPAEAEETVESAVEHLGLPPLTAVRPDARASAAVMLSIPLLPPLSLPPPPQPPAQRTAAESAAAERAAAEEAKERAAAERAAEKARREVRERRMCEEGERALWYEAARASTTWRRLHDPSDDEGGRPCPEACEPLFEAQDKVGDEAGDKVGEEADDPDKDEINRRVAAAKRRQVREADEEDYDLPSVLRAHPGDTSSDVYERWCDYGPELMRGRPCRPYRPPAPQMPPKPPEPQPQEPLEHSAGAFEERRDLPASLQSKLEVSDIMIEQLRYRLSKAHGSVQFSPFSSVHMAAAGGEIHQLHVELQKLLRERVGLDRQDGK